MRLCSICAKKVDVENAPILAMGGFGNPKYLCDECAEDVDTAIGAEDAEKIEEAMARISKKLSVAGTDSELVVETVKEIFAEAGERARKIKDGTFDSSEKKEEEPEYEIPEDMLESEEDKKLDEQDAKKAKKIDRIFSWIAAAIMLATVIFVGIDLLLK